MNQACESLEERIRKFLLKSGFPLEISMCQKLEKRKWLVFPNEYYRDSETQMDKEIDIIARGVESDHGVTKIDEKLICITLLIECKRKSDKPWVFFLRDKGGQSFIGTLKFSTNIGEKKGYILTKEQKGSIHDISELLQFDSLSQYKFTKYATSYVIPFTDNEKEKREIYEAVNSVYSALKNEKPSFESKSFLSQPSMVLVNFFLPVIIFEGDLYTATLQKDDFHLKKVDYIPYILNSGDEEIRRSLIHIVNSKAIDAFLQMIEYDLRLLFNRVESLQFERVEKTIHS